MTTQLWFRAVAVMAAAFSVGCGGKPKSTEDSTDDIELSAELRLRGENNPGYSFLSARIREVSVQANGMNLPVESGASDLDLAKPDHAWLLGEVSIPKGVEKLQVTLSFWDFGAFTDPSGYGPVDYRAISPMSFEADTELMRRNGRVVLQFELDQMFVKNKQASGLMALKYFMVRY